ncbi:MAG: hypothetical protein JXA53_00100 [Bacteroidales bacterium]|nr:hypothetical protein [Bacteroidales bacterium]
MTNTNSPQDIVNILKTKTESKLKALDNTQKVMGWLNETIINIAKECNSLLTDSDSRIKLKATNRTKQDCELQVADELLVFNMHSNVFEFDRDHNIWKMPYAKENKLSTYCGVINIYNFLADSFSLNRFDDLGYLVARVFINKDMHFFVEGKRQLGFIYNNFGTDLLTKENLKKIITTSIDYTLDFDLLVPPYETVKMATVAQINYKISTAKVTTGKRLGYVFQSDDVNG